MLRLRAARRPSRRGGTGRATPAGSGGVLRLVVGSCPGQAGATAKHRFHSPVPPSRQPALARGSEAQWPALDHCQIRHPCISRAVRLTHRSDRRHRRPAPGWRRSDRETTTLRPSERRAREPASRGGTYGVSIVYPPNNLLSGRCWPLARHNSNACGERCYSITPPPSVTNRVTARDRDGRVT